MNTVELSEVEIAGRTSLECVKVAIGMWLREGHDASPTVEVSPATWENCARQVESSGRYYRFDDMSSSRVVIVTIALGREIRIVADPKVTDRVFRVVGYPELTTTLETGLSAEEIQRLIENAGLKP